MDNYEPLSVSGTVFNKMRDQTDGNLFGSWNPNKYDVEDTAFGFIKMKNGAAIFLESAWILNTRDPKEASSTFYETKRWAELKWSLNADKNELIYNMIENGQYKEIKESSINKMEPAEVKKDSLGHLEAASWINAIIRDKEPAVKSREAFIVTKILEAIYESERREKEVQFKI